MIPVGKEETWMFYQVGEGQLIMLCVYSKVQICLGFMQDW